MARKPDGSEPKRHLQLNIELSVYERTRQMFLEPHGAFGSFSELTETLLLLSRLAYHEQPAEHFIRRLLRVKAIKELAAEDLTTLPPQKRLHAYIDKEALCFLDFLVGKYPLVFPHRKDALELIYCYALMYSATEKAYFFSRLEELRNGGRANTTPA